MSNDLEIIQDWINYDESLLFSSSKEYYAKNGIKAYSRASGNPIPSEISNCYPHAKILIQILQNINPESASILDLGAGSGFFAKYCLEAALELGLKLKIIIGDISYQSLKDIQNLGLLDQFKEGKDYELAVIDVFDLKAAKSLNGTPIILKDLDAISLNFFYDAMPMQVLRRNANQYEALQFRFAKTKQIEEMDINFLRSLLIEERWIGYSSSNQIAAKYSSLLDQAQPNPHGTIYFNYGSLFATEELLKCTHDEGFIYASDMPNNFNLQSSFQIYGNAAAHHLNLDLLNILINKLNYKSWTKTNGFVERMIYAKDLKILEPSIQKYLINTDNVSLYADLRNTIVGLNSHYSQNIFKNLLEELIAIDSHSQFSFWARAKYYEMLQDLEKAHYYSTEAAKLDFLKLV